jgi:hypothetical protein
MLLFGGPRPEQGNIKISEVPPQEDREPGLGDPLQYMYFPAVATRARHWTCPGLPSPVRSGPSDPTPPPPRPIFCDTSWRRRHWLGGG